MYQPLSQSFTDKNFLNFAFNHNGSFDIGDPTCRANMFHVKPLGIGSSGLEDTHFL